MNDAQAFALERPSITHPPGYLTCHLGQGPCQDGRKDLRAMSQAASPYLLCTCSFLDR